VISCIVSCLKADILTALQQEGITVALMITKKPCNCLKVQSRIIATEGTTKN